MKFLKENDTVFALIQNEEYKGQMCEEVLFAEINKTSKGYEVLWEDNHREKHLFQDLADAKQYIVLEAHKHSGYINGRVWEVGDE